MDLSMSIIVQYKKLKSNNYKMIKQPFPIVLRIYEFSTVIKAEKLRVWNRFPYFRLLYDEYDYKVGDELDQAVRSELERHGDVNEKDNLLFSKAEFNDISRMNFIGSRKNISYQCTPNLPDEYNYPDSDYRRDESLNEYNKPGVSVYSSALEEKHHFLLPDHIGISLPSNKLNYLIRTFDPDIFSYMNLIP